MLWRGHVHSAGCGKRRLPGARLGLGTRLSPRYFLLGSVIGCQRSRRLTIPGAVPPQNKEPQTRSHCLQGDIASWGQTGGEVRTPPSYFLLGSDCLRCQTIPAADPPQIQELLPAGAEGWSLPLDWAAWASPGLFAAPRLQGTASGSPFSRGGPQARGARAELLARPHSQTFHLRVPRPLQGDLPGSWAVVSMVGVGGKR